MMDRKRIGGALVLLVGIAASAHGGGVYYAVPVVPHCYPLPLVVYPSWTYVAPVVMPLAVPLAVPTPAPPSREPPLLKKIQMPPADKAMGPTVIEARSPSAALATDRCRVGFWNMTGKDVMLVVDGETRLLPRDRALTLDVPREFVWRIDQQPARTERVATEKATMELVIR